MSVGLWVRTAPFMRLRWLVPDRVIETTSRQLFPMPPREAARVLAHLSHAGVSFVLAGGWGVDALTGEVKRRHSDLDVLIAPDALPVLDAALADLNYSRNPQPAQGGWWAPITAVFRDPGGRRIEALLLTTDGLEPLISRAEALLRRTVDGAPATGRVATVKVDCLSAALQLAAHDGFKLTRSQRRDLRLLDSLAGR